MRWVPLGLLMILVILLTGCGARTIPPRHHPATRVVLAWPQASLAALPIQVAARSGWLQHAGYDLVHASGGPGVNPGGRWPATALLLQRSDLVLISPIPEPDFRWRNLSTLPLPEMGLSSDEEALVRAMLREHGVKIVTWERLAPAAAETLFRRGHLPWLLLPMTTAARALPNGHPIAYVGAGTGPVPAWVISGPSLPVPFLAVVNRALVYIATHPASDVARLVQGAYPGTPLPRLETLIAEAQGLGLFPASTYLPAPLFNHGRDLMTQVGVAWPPYASAVQEQTARSALLIWP